jgi:hypothetical protein
VLTTAPCSLENTVDRPAAQLVSSPVDRSRRDRRRQAQDTLALDTLRPIQDKAPVDKRAWAAESRNPMRHKHLTDKRIWAADRTAADSLFPLSDMSLADNRGMRADQMAEDTLYSPLDTPLVDKTGLMEADNSAEDYILNPVPPIVGN